MKIAFIAGSAAVLIGLLYLAAPAMAQFGPPPTETPRAAVRQTPTGPYRIKPEAARYGSIAVYPFAPFVSGGRLTDTVAGTTTEYGALFAGQFGTALLRNRTRQIQQGAEHAEAVGRERYSALEVGGWYWTKGSSDLYQIHLRGFVNPRFGVQLGYLGSTNSKATGSAYTGFLVYEIRSRDQVPRGDEKAPRPRRAWNIETGLGIFEDPGKGRETTSGSVYVNASVELGRGLMATSTFWYVRDRSTDFNRFALGLGYHF